MPDWVRPAWLLALIPLVLLLIWIVRTRLSVVQWEQVVDEALLPYVIEAGSGGARRWPLVLLGVCWLVVVIVLAGPVWTREEMPLYKSQSAMIVVLDLSQSMNADDIEPDRLTRARFKVSDLLDRAEGQQTGLVVFSEAPYVISPLTDDMATLKAFLPALDTAVVPVQGSQLAPALRRAGQLLTQADVIGGAVVVLTDARGDDAAIDAAKELNEAGHRLYILGVGTLGGSPVRGEDGGFLQDNNGNIVVASLDRDSLSNVATAGGGFYSDVSPIDDDLDAIKAAFANSGAFDDTDDSYRATTSHWIEYAPWALLVVAASGLLAFRRGVLS